MNLSEIRKKIDEIDSDILGLLSKRNSLIPFVFDYKLKNNISQFQPQREKELIEKKVKIAKELGISEDIVESIFKLIIKESHRIQTKLGRNNSKSTNIFDFELNKFSKILNINISLFEVFKRIYANYANFFILESLTDDVDFSKYSYCGFGPKITIKAKGNLLFIDGVSVKYKESSPWEFLKNNFPCNLIHDDEGFVGGLVGYNSFESYKYIEPSLELKENSSFYDFEYGLYLEGLKYNHIRNEFTYFSLIGDNSSILLDNIDSPIDLIPFNSKETFSIPNIDFDNALECIIENIRVGNVFQVVPSIRFDYEVSGSSLSFYEKLRISNPSPYMFFVKFDDRQIIGSSPELVFSIKNDRVETYPIAGTRSRGKTIEEDILLEKELLNDVKENAEHMMLVDMARNDIGKVCKFGTIKVDKLKVIKKFSHVQHIVSFVSGIIMDDKNMFDAFIENFPMGTVSGSPKIEAVKIINSIEKMPRGPYGGGIGFFSFNGEAMMAMIIRSLFISGNKAYTQAGAGIVLDSIIDFEKKECIKKSMTIRSII